MEVTIFLAKLLGLLFVVSGISVLINHKDLQKAMADLANNYFLIYMLGYLIVIVGLMLVLKHNVWQGGLRTTITILNWIILIKGLLLVLLPKRILNNNITTINTTKIYITSALVAILFGAYLTVVGFSA